MLELLNTKVVVHVEVCDCCFEVPRCCSCSSAYRRLPKRLTSSRVSGGRAVVLVVVLLLSCLPLLFLMRSPTPWLSAPVASLAMFLPSGPGLRAPPLPPEPMCAAFNPPRWHTDNRHRFEPMWLTRPNASRCAAIRDPEAPTSCACGVTAGTIVLRSTAGRGFLSSFPGGGEVFAIGRIGRMPLSRLVFHLTPAERPPWVRLTHAYSNATLVMLPPNAKEGSWMLMAIPSDPGAQSDVQGGVGGPESVLGATESHRASGREHSGSDLFCLTPSSTRTMGGALYAHGSGGYLNAREGFSRAGPRDPHTAG